MSALLDLTFQARARVASYNRHMASASLLDCDLESMHASWRREPLSQISLPGAAPLPLAAIEEVRLNRSEHVGKRWLAVAIDGIASAAPCSDPGIEREQAALIRFFPLRNTDQKVQA